MKKEETTEFLQKFSSLPPKLQNLLSSSQLGETVKDALRLAGVTEEKYYDKLFNLVCRVLMLELPVHQFSSALSQNFTLPAPTLRILKQVIQSKIFNQVQKELSSTPSFSSFPLPDTKKEKTSSPPPLSVSPLRKIKVPLSSSQKDIPLSSPNKQQNQVTPKPSPTTPSNSSLPKKGETPSPSQPPPRPPSVLPEPLNITVEKPVTPPSSIKPVNPPQIQPKEQKEINNKLLQAMLKRKKEQPAIVEEMKKVEQNPPVVSPKKKSSPPKHYKAQVEASKIVAGENSLTPPNPSSNKTAQPYIFNVKLKEFKEKKKTKPIHPQEIPYKKLKPRNPFGES